MQFLVAFIIKQISKVCDKKNEINGQNLAQNNDKKKKEPRLYRRTYNILESTDLSNRCELLQPNDSGMYHNIRRISYKYIFVVKESD